VIRANAATIGVPWDARPPVNGNDNRQIACGDDYSIQPHVVELDLDREDNRSRPENLETLARSVG
jgi:hypothetical protein